MLGQKQRTVQQDWLTAYATITDLVSWEHMQVLVEQTLDSMTTVLAQYPRAAYAWSAGKDSLVLQSLMERLHGRRCVMALTHLEYPAVLAWVTDHMPSGLTVINSGQDLAWLAVHPHMLFPQDATTAARWFRQVQHRVQAQYFREQRCGLLVLGRRRLDGNYCGPPGQNLYRKADGVTRYSPLSAWTHEEVLAYLHYFHLDLPPYYSWPRGFQVGTGPWPARQWTGSIAKGWMEIWQIDPSIVQQAAPMIDSAQQFLDAQGAS